MTEKEGILRAIVELDNDIFRITGVKDRGAFPFSTQAVLDFQYTQREKLKEQLSELTDPKVR